MNMQKLRILSRIFLLILLTVHIVTWYVLGIHIAGSIGIEALFSGLSRGIINAGFIFWMLVFASALLFGRSFCGWFCWFGGYVELADWGISKTKIKMPRWTLLYLGVIPFIALSLKIYSALLVNWLKVFPSTFSYQLADTPPWGGQQTGVSILITLILYGPVLFLVFGRRAWCRYLCPLGALLKIFSKVGIGKVRLVNDKCIGCGKCNRSCDMQVDVLGELKKYGEVRSLNCIRCLKCIDICPNGAIAFTMRRKNLLLSADAASRAEKISLKRRKISAFDIIITALWIGVTMIFILANVSQKAPMEIKVFMTAGLLLIIYTLVWIMQKLWIKTRREKQDTG